MSSEKIIILKQFKPKRHGTSCPKQLEVTGSRVELVPARKIPAATPLTEADDFNLPLNPWHETACNNAGAGAKKLLLTVKSDESLKGATQTRQSAGKGWTVAVSASRELYDPDMMDHSQYLPFLAMEKETVSVPLDTTYEISNHARRVPPVSTVRPSHGSSHLVPGKPRQSGSHRPAGQHAMVPDDSVERMKRREKPHPQKQQRKKIRSLRHLNSRGNLRKETKSREQAIRTKYLERKYGLEWAHRVFGHVLPSSARRHYAATLMRKVFVAWREEWWVERREWKLGIRAECHNRYRCWIMVWNAWTRYTATCQAKKRKKSTSDTLFSRLVVQRAWRGWREDWKRRKEKKEEKRFCCEWHVKWLKRRSWLRWQQALSVRVRGRAMELTALHYWASALERRVLLRWRAAYSAKRATSRQWTIACRHAGKKMEQVVMRAWWDYVLLRRHKLYLRRVAVGSHNSALLLKWFSHWKTRFSWNREVAQFEGLILHKNRLSICRRAISHWKFFVALRRHEADKLELAVQQHTFTLKAKGLQAFRGYLHQQRRMVLYKQQAMEFHVKCRLRQCWGQWLQRCEHNEEIALGPLTRKARGHTAAKLSHKVLAAWVQYIIHCRQRNRLKLAADAHFGDTALPKCLEAFKANLSISKYKRELKDTSESFRSEMLLSMGFYKWWREFQLSQDIRMLERVAILHSEEVAKRHWLQLWRRRHRMVNVHYQQEEMAAEYSSQKVLSVAFRKWVSRTELRAHSRSEMERAAEHSAVKLEGTVWKAWRMHVARKRGSHACKTSAGEHHQRVVLRKVLDSWKHYHRKAVVKSHKERAAVALRSVWLQRQALVQWKEGVRDRKYSRQLHQTATDHHTQWTLLKHLRGWREVTLASKQEREQEDTQVSEATADLLKARASRVLHTWRAQAESERRERQGQARAAQHHHGLLKRKLLRAWKQYHQTRLRKAILNARCEQFRDTRVLCGAYVVWKHQLMSALQCKQRGVVSLWHWSHVLEHKALRAWLLYAREKRRKVDRYALGMERHRTRLLGVGVRQWIRVATHWKAQREEMALNIQAKNTQKVFRCVRRCAHHWRELARKHRPPHPAATRLAAPLSAGTIQCSTGVWTSLARQLNLPDGVSFVRPQPRRPAPFTTALSEALPRLLPPPSPHAPKPGEPRGAGQGTSSLDVTAEPSTDQTTSQTSLSSPREPLPPSRPFRGRQPASPQPLPPVQEPLPPSHPLPASSQPLPPAQDPLPLSHPLREKSIREEVLVMRERLRQYLQLKIQQKSLLDALADSRLQEEERMQLQGELGEVEALVLHTQPILKEVAIKVDKLLQLCS